MSKEDEKKLVEFTGMVRKEVLGDYRKNIGSLEDDPASSIDSFAANHSFVEESKEGSVVDEKNESIACAF